MKCYRVVLLTTWPNLWHLTLKLVGIARGVGNLPTNLVFVSFSTYRPTPVRHVTWPCDLDLWPWRSRRLSLIRVNVLRLWTKFELRRPSRSEDIGHLLCEHQSAWWPWPLTFEPQNSTISRVSLYQVWTLWDHSFLSYAACGQTDWLENPTHADRQSRRW